ncbi:hypothetical protein BN10_720038 [Phycicoccus elongatus Lp2]|uniref:Uncharacterized protein n=1 Tax=Phycicoccus elongatus Lp2 TaxID=1193181 RepID=N0E623_9MICO|nr:hypothetical protein BN10_720038 [Phycicoccus elongatus Lp2]
MRTSRRCLAVVKNLDERSAELGCVPRRSQHSGAGVTLPQDLLRGGYVRRHDRTPHGQGFNEGSPEPFALGREAEYIGCGQECVHVGSIAEEPHVCAQGPGLALEIWGCPTRRACDKRHSVGVPCQDGGYCGHEVLEALRRLNPPNGQHHRAPRVNGEFASYCLALLPPLKRVLLWVAPTGNDVDEVR